MKMKLKMMASCCLLWIVFSLPAQGQTCGQIATWTDADASFFVSLESPFVKVLRNSPRRSPQFGMDVTELEVYGNLNSWQVTARITSFQTAVEAANALEKIRAGIYPEDVFSAGEPFAYVSGYYMPPPAGDGSVGDFHLVTVHQENLIQVNGGGSLRRSPGDCLDSYTVLANNAIELIRSKCGDNREPFIALLPLPSQGLAFQVSLLEGKGFQILVQDPDGLGDIDWNTFKVFVAGNDTTAHFLAVLQSQNGPTLKAETPQNAILLTIVPDPKKLMEAHDLFATPFNGDYRIDLEICDSKGACARSENTVYFGPFLTIAGDVSHLRCSDASAEWWRMEIRPLIAGNTGYDSVENRLYFVLHSKEDTQKYWSCALPWYYGQTGVQPTIKNQPFLAGESRTVFWPMSIANGSGLQSGTYEFMVGVWDTEYGTIQVDVKDVQLCIPSGM